MIICIQAMDLVILTTYKRETIGVLWTLTGLESGKTLSLKLDQIGMEANLAIQG